MTRDELALEHHGVEPAPSPTDIQALVERLSEISNDEDLGLGTTEVRAALREAVDLIASLQKELAGARARGDSCLYAQMASEARADALAQEVERLKPENGRLRNVVSKVCAALPNGAFCSPECSIEFMEEVPGEVAGVIAALGDRP